MISFDQALDLVRQHVRPAPTVTLPLFAARDSYLAEDVFSVVDLPPFDNSAVDGYAISDLDGGGARCIREIRAGQYWDGVLREGECARIFTGAPVPKGAVAVVMQEDVEVDGSTVSWEAVSAGANIRLRGEELRAGDLVLRRGSQLTPPAVSALASAGIESVCLHEHPNVGILAAGDEVVPVGRPLMPGQIYESNAEALRAALGGRATSQTLSDDPDGLREALGRLLRERDVIITSGGVSVGDHDHIRPILAELGVEQVFWQVAMKPAKPVYFGVSEKAVVFGLPGNPVSALTAFYLLVKPYLVAARGGAFGLEEVRALTSERITKRTGREEFLPARLRDGVAEPILGRASHKPTCLADANCLIRVATEVAEVPAGSSVRVVPLRW